MDGPRQEHHFALARGRMNCTNVNIAMVVLGELGVCLVTSLTGVWLGYSKGRSSATVFPPVVVASATEPDGEQEDQKEDEKEECVEEQIESSLCPKCGYEMAASIVVWIEQLDRMQWKCDRCTATWTTPPLNLDKRGPRGDSVWYTRRVNGSEDVP